MSGFGDNVTDPSAQRLSASTEGSRVGRFRIRTRRVCSTPFGINGRVTNCMTRAGTDWAGAQRLSASTEGSHAVAWTPKHDRNVLNAFRHQRKGHPPIRLAVSHCKSVLNAFRHQRKGHFSLTVILVTTAGCSTPFGINGRVTFDFPAVTWYRQMCSTPFGINGRVTSYAVATDSFTRECSTPFGINGRVTADTIHHRRAANHVLNAFRHQRKGHPVPMTPHPWAIRAQRLSASTEGSPVPSSELLAKWTVCSTPFGINGRVTGNRAVTCISRSMCSTPFGINGRVTGRSK